MTVIVTNGVSSIPPAVSSCCSAAAITSAPERKNLKKVNGRDEVRNEEVNRAYIQPSWEVVHIRINYSLTFPLEVDVQISIQPFSNPINRPAPQHGQPSGHLIE